jgi:hypothetical protein
MDRKAPLERFLDGASRDLVKGDAILEVRCCAGELSKVIGAMGTRKWRPLDSCRNQAIPQVRAFSSPFLVSMSVIEIFRQLQKGHPHVGEDGFENGKSY